MATDVLDAAPPSEPLERAGGVPPAPPRQAERRRAVDRIALPLALALGVRCIVFGVANLGARFIAPSAYTNPLLIWKQWDAVWYLMIAQQGYAYSPTQGSLVDFFPLFPVSVWLAHLALAPFVGAGAYLLAGMVIAWGCFAAACVVLYNLALERFGPTTALGAVALLATFPFGVYFGAPFSESPYLLLAVSAFYAVERRWWWAAGVAALLAGAVRPPGLIVGAAVALAYALDWLRTRHRLRRDLLALALTPLGTAAYLVYCWLRFGDPLAYQKTSRAGWHGGYLQLGGIRYLWHAIVSPDILLTGKSYTPVQYSFYALLFLVFLALLIPVARLLGAPYFLYSCVGIVAPIATFPSMDSTGRYLSVVFPAFLALAYLIRSRPIARELLVITSALMLGVIAVMFVTGYAMP